MTFARCDAALITTFGRKKLLTILTECRTWLILPTKCRTRRNVASTKICRIGKMVFDELSKPFFYTYVQIYPSYDLTYVISWLSFVMFNCVFATFQYEISILITFVQMPLISSDARGQKFWSEPSPTHTLTSLHCSPMRISTKNSCTGPYV